MSGTESVETLLEAVTELARLAGDTALAHFRGGVAVELKGDGSPVTIADRASERMAVSPGREAEGYFHMPAGQSGHPLSPNYADGHRAWATGEATPFLPGPAVHTLTFQP